MRHLWTAVLALVVVGMLIAGCPSSGEAKNKKPVASFTPDTSVVFVGDTVTLNASASKDPDGKIKTYDWRFWDGDGLTDQTTPTATKQLDQPGICNITLTVKDAKGAVSSQAKGVMVVVPLPRGIYDSVRTFEPVAFGIDFYWIPDQAGVVDKISEIEWTFGDGTPTVKGENASHAYAKKGTYNPTVKVTASGKSATAKVLTSMGGKDYIQILNTGPVPNITVAPAPLHYTNQPIEFRGNASSDIDGQVVKWRWEFGDGSTSDETNPSHAYTADGPYQVNLTVTDNDNATDIRWIFVTVLKDLVIKDISAVLWQDNESGGHWKVNLTVKFDSEGGAKAAGTINFTARSYNGYTQQPLEPVEDFTANATNAAAIPAGSSKDNTVLINGLRVHDAEPGATAIKVELRYLGNLMDLGWHEL